MVDKEFGVQYAFLFMAMPLSVNIIETHVLVSHTGSILELGLCK